MPFSETKKRAFSEQDTADKLILPYLTQKHGFPSPDSLDYQAQHYLPIDEEHAGKYDGLYLHGGYPFVVLEAKRYAHDLTLADQEQARKYAISDLFDEPVPFIVVSNGREYKFSKKSTELHPKDGKVVYRPITETHWNEVITESPGKVRVLLTAEQLLSKLKDIKEWIYRDIRTLFFDFEANKYALDKCSGLKENLQKIIDERKIYIGTTSDPQKQIEFAIQTIALHFTLKILFIKIVEDLSSGSDTPRVIHNLFPKEEYALIGGIFGHRVLSSLINRDRNRMLKLYLKSKKFYARLGQDIARITYEDIFRYGFHIHMREYGKILKARNYDLFFPSGETLQQIREELIKIDIRAAIVYASEDIRNNVIGDIYGKLIDEELRDSIGAVYTPDDTVEFMVALGRRFLKRFRGKKIVENACGSGHFYRQIYRCYVNEVVEDYRNAGHQPSYHEAHSEALEHVLGRDIDPFAIQLTLLGVFLEQLKDNVKAITLHASNRPKLWKANDFIDCQNSLDPITVKPNEYFTLYKSSDFEKPKDLLKSCKNALEPQLIIGNPPYGVKVVKGPHYDDIYNLQSKDSFGYFIANAIERLPEAQRLIFITSSSYLTIKSHLKLRELILQKCKIIRMVKLHRATFPGIDIFPVITELEKCSNPDARYENFYQFYDLWQLHPVKNKPELRQMYGAILDDLTASGPWPFDSKRVGRYNNRQGIIYTCSQFPIFDGLPSLFQFMEDSERLEDPTITLHNNETRRPDKFRVKQIRGVNVLKLGKITIAKQGLIPPSTRDYYRIAHGSRGGAVKGGYIEVDLHLALTVSQVERLSATEKENGIVVDDFSHDKYFVPLDKTGASDIEGKILSQYYRPIEFYVNWSKNAVRKMKTDKSGRFQGDEHYFKKGISYSDTGIYSPTFRLSHGGIFDQKGSCIFCDYLSREFLLGLLCSKLIKYFVKVFINHSVSAQVDSIKEIPIALANDDQKQQIENKVNEIITFQQSNPSYDYYSEQMELDQMIYQLYRLEASEIREVEDWYDRRYPKLRRDIDTSRVEEG